MSTTVTTPPNPWGRVSQTHRVRVYPHGRLCAHEDCETILSIYNPSAYCGAHADLARSKRRRSELHPVRDVACAHCGASFQTQNSPPPVLQRQVPDGGVREAQAGGATRPGVRPRAQP